MPLGGAVEAAVDVAGADHDRHLDAAVADRRDLLGDAVDLGAVGAEVQAAHQGLAGELQQDAPEARLGETSVTAVRAYSSPTRK